ncbi:hypothetical protein VIGAN_03007300 [Vigna angularis var. angularis]|uniref:Uncharacterized protein n=1 Tax=Vigna angularis var. angularis TaxID=157739 RepID=A0A0S3RIZ4_PHAAN|nr:hypothetical protein VIGAN_03007300 [Vigna angularis var. angularis]
MMIPVAVGSSSLCWKFLSFTFFSKVGGSLSSSSFPKMKSYPPRMVVAAERVLSWWLADQTRLASSPMPRYKKDRVLPLVVQLVVYVPRAAGCSPGVSSFSRDPSLHLWVSSPLSKQHSQKANLPKPKLREFSLEVYHSLFPPILFFLSWKKDVTESYCWRISLVIHLLLFSTSLTKIFFSFQKIPEPKWQQACSLLPFWTWQVLDLKC